MPNEIVYGKNVGIELTPGEQLILIKENLKRIREQRTPKLVSTTNKETSS